VDAALDNTNVAKIANYIRAQASDTFQFIVISLKGSLYERGNSLVGIYRDQDVNSSRTLTLDVSGSREQILHMKLIGFRSSRNTTNKSFSRLAVPLLCAPCKHRLYLSLV
jgi:RecF/RecN/SMC N terminal domain